MASFNFYRVVTTQEAEKKHVLPSTRRKYQLFRISYRILSHFSGFVSFRGFPSVSFRFACFGVSGFSTCPFIALQSQHSIHDFLRKQSSVEQPLRTCIEETRFVFNHLVSCLQPLHHFECRKREQLRRDKERSQVRDRKQQATLPDAAIDK